MVAEAYGAVPQARPGGMCVPPVTMTMCVWVVCGARDASWSSDSGHLFCEHRPWWGFCLAVGVAASIRTHKHTSCTLTHTHTYSPGEAEGDAQSGTREAGW